MSDYVSRVNLEINGLSITDFAAVTEEKVEIGKKVHLMNATGFCNRLPRYELKVDYVIPSDTPEFDFTIVKGGTLTIDYQNGTRKTYSGVSTLEIGNAKYDGEKEATKEISLMATGVITETATG